MRTPANYIVVCVTSDPLCASDPLSFARFDTFGDAKEYAEQSNNVGDTDKCLIIYKDAFGNLVVEDLP